MNNTDLKNIIIENFATQEAAEQAFNIAIQLGYKPEEINILMSEEARKAYYEAHKTPPDSEEDAVKLLTVGGVVGGAIGSSIGALLAVGTSLAVPGLGLVMIGPLAGAGGVYGGLLGSIIGWGTPDNPPNVYEERLKKGEIILIVHEVPGKPSLKEAWKPFVSPITN